MMKQWHGAALPTLSRVMASYNGSERCAFASFMHKVFPKIPGCTMIKCEYGINLFSVTGHSSVGSAEVKHQRGEVQLGCFETTRR